MFRFSELLFSESVCILNAWSCVWLEQGIMCWMFCVVFTKSGLFGLSPYYFLGQAWLDLWSGMTNVCFCCELNNVLNV